MTSSENSTRTGFDLDKGSLDVQEPSSASTGGGHELIPFFVLQ